MTPITIKIVEMDMMYLLSLNHVSKLHQRSDLACSLSLYIYLIFCFIFLLSIKLIINKHLFCRGLGKNKIKKLRADLFTPLKKLQIL